MPDSVVTTSGTTNRTILISRYLSRHQDDNGDYNDDNDYDDFNHYGDYNDIQMTT